MLRLLACCLLLALPARADDVRIRLYEPYAPQLVRIGAVEGALELFAGDADAPLVALPAGASAMLSVRNGEVFVTADDQRLYAVAVRAVPAPGGAIEVEVIDGEGDALPAPRQYRGPVRADVAAGPLRLIHTADLEDYVAGVVAREYGFDDLEGAKAVAVAVRTYALYAAGRFGPDYDLLDHTDDQVFAGVGGVPDVAFEAAWATEGEVLTHEGEPIEAVYFASSGGHTADNEAVWDGRPRPYLRGKPDPYDASPHASWRSVVPREALLEVLTREIGAPAEGFVIGEIGAEGRVQTVDVLVEGGTRLPMRAARFRTLVNGTFGTSSLKSTFFDAHRSGDAYVFEGSGYGHGVGLAQWGAREMSRQGYTYRDILAFYYTGVTLEAADGEQLALRAPDVSLEPPPSETLRPDEPPRPEEPAVREAEEAERPAPFAERVRSRPPAERNRRPAAGWTVPPAPDRPTTAPKRRIGW